MADAPGVWEGDIIDGDIIAGEDEAEGLLGLADMPGEADMPGDVDMPGDMEGEVDMLAPGALAVEPARRQGFRALGIVADKQHCHIHTQSDTLRFCNAELASCAPLSGWGRMPGHDDACQLRQQSCLAAPECPVLSTPCSHRQGGLLCVACDVKHL